MIFAMIFVGEETGPVFYKRLDCQNSFGKPFSKIYRFAVNSYQRIIPETLCFILLKGKDAIIKIYLGPNQQYFVNEYIRSLIVVFVSFLSRLPKNTASPPYLPSSRSKTSFHYLMFVLSRYFLIRWFLKIY